MPWLGGLEAPAPDPWSWFSATRIDLGRKELVPGVEVALSLAHDRASAVLEVLFHGLVVFRASLDEEKLTERFSGHQGLFKEDLTFTIDLREGEITIGGDLCVRGLGGWACTRFTDHVLVAWSPTIGAVGGSIQAHPPQINDPSAGPSRSIVSTIMRIPIDTVPRLGSEVGSMVKKTFFADVPDFLFNVCFSVGAFSLGGPGLYGNPTSPWFNVFAGYYQIDCPKPSWSRPFGYDIAGSAPAVRYDEVLRIGKSDWNYFSNWMYGVPLDAIVPYDAPDPDVRCATMGREKVGRSQWDLVDLDGFSAVSAYQSSAPGAAQLVENTILTPMWRLTFGEPESLPGRDTSFLGTKMHARLYMAFTEDEGAYHTYLFGGTVNKAFDGPENTRLLEEQLASCRGIIEGYYSSLGFPMG
ncbi:hypothetical protein A7982_12534 [Minicystis rosea]|nr:hypothetical protein A7982_12534 [Minicystis rosea]